MAKRGNGEEPFGSASSVGASPPERAALRQFCASLKRLIGEPTDLRPFICEGSPLECRIFIVGCNPVTNLGQSFWRFWEEGYGFQKSRWLEEYKRERSQRPLRPGKTRRNAVSNTRRVIEWVVEAAAPEKCLETNLYATASMQARELARGHRDTAPFDFLLRAIRPRVILLHGRDAREHLQELYGIELAENTLSTTSAGSGDLTMLAVPHLSRGWSRERAWQVGEILRAACQGGGTS